MRLLTILLSALLLAACSNQESITASNDLSEKQIKLVAILPMDSASGLHWKRTADWFNENLEDAFKHVSIDSTFTFDIEWVDENRADMDSLGDALTKQKNIAAIIGPLHSQNVGTIAQYLQSANNNGNRIPMIAPMATAAEIIRKYTAERWFFELTDSDISQSEILLSQVIASYANSVTLLISSSEEQKTFLDWFTFQASEFELSINIPYIYDDSTELANMAEKAFSKNNDFVVCIPQSYADIPTILKAYKKHGKKNPLLFGNTAHNKNILNYNDIEGIEGISIGASPESGFDIAYTAKFKEAPIAGEAQVYDALLLAAFAQLYVWTGYSRFIDASITQVIANDSAASDFPAWESIPMSRIMKKILNEENFNIAGASGNLNIKSENDAVITQTFYTHWKVSNKTFVQMEYLSLDGSRRTVSTTASSNWINKIVSSTFIEDDSTSSVKYPYLQGNYALLIATSENWLNYRHQADILSLYKKLKSFGMDDDHIILIIEDNLAENSMNPNPGTLIDFNGAPIYEDVKVDYKVSELSPEDLLNITTGQKSDRLPTVIEADSSQNVFVFWSGHGTTDGLTWPNDETFTQQHMKEIIEEMSNAKNFRKMLWMFETCYAGNICRAFTSQEQQGALCIAASNAVETSKAVDFNSDYKTYMTNSFTKNFLHELNQLDINDEFSNIPLNDLYYYLVKNTLGSHVSMYNSNNYGSLHFSGIREFITTN